MSVKFFLSAFSSQRMCIEGMKNKLLKDQKHNILEVAILSTVLEGRRSS